MNGNHLDALYNTLAIVCLRKTDVIGNTCDAYFIVIYVILLKSSEPGGDASAESN
jgi:hypothetical protein